MTNRPDGYVSRSDIARLAEVRRPAVTNWERRHRDFPPPVSVGGEELFEASVIGAWLDRRMIASNALVPGERVGSTYGDRFRGNLVARPEETTEYVPVLPATERASGDRHTVWEKLDRLRGPVEVAQYRDLVLGLAYLRIREDDSWTAVTRGFREGAAESLLALERLLPGLPYRDSWTSSWSGRELTGIADAVDHVVRDREGAEVFRELLAWFAVREGFRGGEFHTPESVVRVLVESLSPDLPGAVYDPVCEAGGLLAAVATHVREVAGRPPSSLRGDTFNVRSLALAEMNLALHGVEAELGARSVHDLCETIPSSARFDYVVTNPPFNMSGWCSGDPAHHGSWPYGPPPAHNANFAWLQRVVGLLARGGRAGVVMPPNTTFSENERERAIRENLVRAGCVEGVITLPSRLFPSTAIAVTVWLLTPPDESRGEVLLVDASGMGQMITRTRRELSGADIRELANIVSRWRQGEEPEPGLAVSVRTENLRRLDYNLNPRVHVVSAPIDASADRHTVETLLRRLGYLHVEAAEADAQAERELGRLQW